MLALSNEAQCRMHPHASCTCNSSMHCFGCSKYGTCRQHDCFEFKRWCCKVLQASWGCSRTKKRNSKNSPDASPEDLDERDLERGDLAVHEDAGEIELDLEPDIHIGSVDGGTPPEREASVRDLVQTTPLGVGQLLVPASIANRLRAYRNGAAPTDRGLLIIHRFRMSNVGHTQLACCLPSSENRHAGHTKPSIAASPSSGMDCRRVPFLQQQYCEQMSMLSMPQSSLNG